MAKTKARPKRPHLTLRRVTSLENEWFGRACPEGVERFKKFLGTRSRVPLTRKAIDAYVSAGRTLRTKRDRCLDVWWLAESLGVPYIGFGSNHGDVCEAIEDYYGSGKEQGDHVEHDDHQA